MTRAVFFIDSGDVIEINERENVFACRSVRVIARASAHDPYGISAWFD